MMCRLFKNTVILRLSILTFALKRCIPYVQISVVDTLDEKLQTTSSVAYTALTLSMTVAVDILVYVTMTRMVLKLKNQNARADCRSQRGDQADPVYEVCTLNTDARDIEMTPNVVYGTHSATN